jgi:hypothetical protein
MAILKIKRLIEDMENNTSVVVGTVNKVVVKATSAGNAGTARVANFASSGTAALAGTSAAFATGL